MNVSWISYNSDFKPKYLHRKRLIHNYPSLSQNLPTSFSWNTFCQRLDPTYNSLDQKTGPILGTSSRPKLIAL